MFVHLLVWLFSVSFCLVCLCAWSFVSLLFVVYSSFVNPNVVIARQWQNDVIRICFSPGKKTLHIFSPGKKTLCKVFSPGKNLVAILGCAILFVSRQTVFV